MPEAVDHSRIRPYGDHLDDGLVQVSFSLPVPYALSAREAALEIGRKMQLEEPEVVHYQRLCDGYTYFVLYGRCRPTVDVTELRRGAFEIEYMSEHEINSYVAEHIGRPIVVVGASTGTDTHSVGIDAILNMKGVDGRHGLEAYPGFRVHNFGSQVPNARLVAEAIEVDADAILVSQTVTQQGLHVGNLTQLVDMIEAEGLRDRVVLCCGGPLVTDELAKELGYDAGFSKGTYPHHVAAYLARAAIERAEHAVAGA